MARKRLDVSFDLDQYADKMVWDYMEGNGYIKSKWVRNILIEYVNGTLKVNAPTVQVEEEVVCDIEIEEIDDLEGLEGF